MAHELYVVNNRASMAYVGAKPWHGLGQELTEDATIEQWMEEAGMNYEILRSTVCYRNAEGRSLKMPERDVLYRSDTMAPLSVVSDGYRVVQPKEVLEFFRGLCLKNGFRLETAGVLQNGQKYWALAKTPQEFALYGQDVVQGHVLLTTSCDGTLATTAKHTSVRVVCANTLRMAMAKGQGIKVRHSSEFNATRVQMDLGILDKNFDEFQTNAVALAQAKIGQDDAVEILRGGLAPETDPEWVRKNGVRAMPDGMAAARILNLWNSGAIGGTLRSANGTAWGLVNATTQYYDHQAGGSQDARLRSAWMGANDDKKFAVFARALQFIAA